jgi:predicted DNA-binding WGR domain protein
MSETATLPLQVLVLDRIDEERNMARYYVLAIEPSLFGDTALIREWGRIGYGGKRRVDLYQGEGRAAVALGVWLARKMRRGYKQR